MTNQPDVENIIIRYILQADETIQKAQEVRARIDAIKQKMKEVAVESKTSLGDVAKGMKEVAKTQMTQEVEKLRSELAQLKNDYKTLTQFEVDEKNANVKAQQEKVEAIRKVRQEYQQTTQAISAAQTEAQKEVSGGGIFGGLGLGKIAGVAGAIVGITSFISLIRNMMTYLGEAANAAKEFTQSLFNMSVGVRALQRQGVDITMQDMAIQVENLKRKFGVFSRVDLVEGSAAFLNLNRDMGFTKEQLFELQDAIATLAVVNGRSMDEVQKTVALALSSGYTEGLQRLGVSINRVTIAEEAARLGWEGGYTALNEQQRALATYNLVIQKTAVYMDDLLEYQKTLPGQIDTTTKAIQDQNVALGQSFQGFILWWQQMKLAFLEVMTYIANLGNVSARLEFISGFVEQQEQRLGRALSTDELMHFIQAANIAWEKASWQGAMSPQQIFERYQIPSEKYNPILGDADAIKSETDKTLSEINGIVEKKLDDIKKAQEDYQDSLKELKTDFDRDMEQMELEHWRRLEDISKDHTQRLTNIYIDYLEKVRDINIDYSQKLDDIQADYDRKVEDAERKYAQDVAQVWTDYYGKVADAQAKYQNQQWKAEQDFQEKMRRLREGFLFDLEDALRERDARQVLQLIRKYQLDKDQLQREFDQTREENWRNFQLQMSDMARQRDERLAQLAAEQAARLEMLQIEADRERADAETDHRRRLEDEDRRYKDRKDAETVRYDQAKTDEATRYEQDRTDRLTRYTQDETDLYNHWKSMMSEIADAIVEGIPDVDEKLGLLKQVLDDTLGEGGESDEIFNNVVQKATEATVAIATLFAYAQYLPTISIPGIVAPTQPQNQTPPPGGKNPTHRYAQGGTLLADRPTTVTFGEDGLEMAQFTPLNRSVINNGFETNITNNVSSRSKEKATVEILLGRDLEGRIIDTTLDQVADVVIKRLRR